MHTEDTFPLSGPYRTTGAGTWKKLAGREYRYGNIHYEFEGRTVLFRIRMRSVLSLSRDGNFFTENGRFEGLDSNDNTLFGGCYSGTANRLIF
ncbi:MAG: hypothetical protein ABI481_06615 [Pyrinomonadaceae bacterium]